MQHLRLPLALTPSGRLATVEADSVEDYTQRLGVLAATTVGERLTVPGYGVPDLLFRPSSGAGTSAGVGSLTDAVREAAAVWEPAAADYAVEVASDVIDPSRITITVEGGQR